MEFKKSCPKCKCDIFYSRKDGLVESVKMNRLCRKCSKIGFTPILTPQQRLASKKGCFKKGSRPANADFRKGKKLQQIYGQEKAKEVKFKFSKRVMSVESNIERSKKCKQAGCGKKNKGRACLEENKKASRIRMANLLIATHTNFHPPYNKVACELFDQIMKHTNCYIQHALNGGQIFIKQLGYWVDGYDKQNNIVYQFDQKRHFNADGTLKNKDIIRQKQIQNHWKCTFKRIKYTDSQTFLADLKKNFL